MVWKRFTSRGNSWKLVNTFWKLMKTVEKYSKPFWKHFVQFWQLFMIGCLTYWSKNRKEGNWLPLELVSAHQKTNVSSEGDATNKCNMYTNISLTRLLESNKFVNSYTVAGILGRWTWIEFCIYSWVIHNYKNK